MTELKREVVASMLERLNFKKGNNNCYYIKDKFCINLPDEPYVDKKYYDMMVFQLDIMGICKTELIGSLLTQASHEFRKIPSPILYVPDIPGGSNSSFAILKERFAIALDAFEAWNNSLNKESCKEEAKAERASYTKIMNACVRDIAKGLLGEEIEFKN